MRGTLSFTLTTLFPPGRVLELRALWKNGGVVSGYYDKYEKMAQDALVLDGTPDLAGIYVVLNEINPDLFSRRANRLNMRLSKDDKTTGDEDILHRHWFPIDIDPRRASGISSTDAEHEKSLEKADKIREFLSEIGWPMPISADSGNGAHLLYRIDLPNDEVSLNLIKSSLSVLSAFFSDDESDIDTTVSNAARIWKLYGTVSRKGDSTIQRPHRRSLIRSCPDELVVVSPDLLTGLASLLPGKDEEHGKGKPNTRNTEDGFSLGAWLHKYGYSCREKSYAGGTLYLFDQCPFSSAHSDGAYAIQFANGGIFAGCHHNSCGGGIQRWHELRERVEGVLPSRDFEAWRREGIKSRAQGKAIRDGILNDPIPSAPDTQGTDTITLTRREDQPDITNTALNVLHQENPIRYILDTFAEEHVGDEIVARCLIMSLASRLVVNSKGLHVLVTGESGKGKSHTFDTMLDLIPQEFCLAGRFSDKSLYYLKDIRKGSVICLDDICLSEQMQETLKGVTTSFQKPFLYRTVDKDRNGITREIPERCVWWVAKKEGTGDDQIWNRMLTAWIDDSIEQDKEVMARELAAAARSTACSPDISPRNYICRALWQQIRSYPVIIPYAQRIRFSSVKNRRNLTMLLDLIRSIALMHQYQREIKVTNGISEVVASEDDFTMAREIFLLLCGASGGQTTKLTKAEYEMVEVIRNNHIVSFTLQEMQKLLSRSRTGVYRIIHSREQNSREYEGLLDKCPPLSFTKQSVLLENGKRQMLNIYSWDYEMDAIWSTAGACWLDNDDDHDEDPRGVQVFHGVPSVFPEEGTSETTVITGSTQNEPVNGPGVQGVPNPVDPCTEQLGADGEVCESDILAHRTQWDQKNCNMDSDSENIPDVPVQKRVNRDGIVLAHCDTFAGSSPASLIPGNRFPLRDINPARCIRVDEGYNRYCDCCGNKGIAYELKAGIRLPDTALPPVICEKCQSAAVAREVLSFRALPGLLPLAGMKRFEKDGGRCSLCHIQPIAWMDDETKIGLCFTCYEREQTVQGKTTGPDAAKEPGGT